MASYSAGASIAEPTFVGTTISPAGVVVHSFIVTMQLSCSETFSLDLTPSETILFDLQIT